MQRGNNDNNNGNDGDTHPGMSKEIPDKEEALQRLVFAMRGHNDDEAASLARRVMSSQIGISQDDDDNYHEQLSSTWRRISRKSTKPKAKAQIESLYKQLSNAQKKNHPDANSNNNAADSMMPPKMLMVLTKLMGKKIKMPSTTQPPTPRGQPSQPMRTASAPPTPTSNANRPTPTMANSNTHSNANAFRSHNNNNNNPNHNNETPRNNKNNTNSSSKPNQPIKRNHSSRGNRTLPISRPVDVQQLRQERLDLENEEALLLRECLYSLQGIDGERIRYYHKENHHHNNTNNNTSSNNNNNPSSLDKMDDYEGVRIQSPALANSLLYSGRVIQTKLGSGAMDALRICGEAGWLYNRIQSYIHEVQHQESKGIVARAFAGTLAEELRDYHSLLTQYESKLADLTLRQIMVELRMPTARLKILALLTDGVRQLTGGHLLSALYKHTLHGDSRHVQLVQTILYNASHPWFDILYLWTTQGVLSDPHGEFFIRENNDENGQQGDGGHGHHGYPQQHYQQHQYHGHQDDNPQNATNFWKHKYCIRKDQIPTGILDPALVRPAYTVGKGINFIRHCLHDGQWTMQLGDLSDDDEDDGETEASLKNRDLGYRYYNSNNNNNNSNDRNNSTRQEGNPALQKTLERAAHLVHTHILRTLKQQCNMMEHLWALKQFLLLGQGDFFSALMEGLHSEFSNEPGVAGIYKHSLLGIVEGALRSTNAKYLPQYVLDRLQVELLLDPEDDAYNTMYNNHNNNIGNHNRDDRRTVWDIFMLGYQLPDPMIAIVYPEALDKYKSVFALLFGLKKVEFKLNYTWRQNATIQHALHTNAQYTGINIATSVGYAQASLLLRKISILRQSMNHLIVNLKSYFMFEVLEGGWKRLEADIDAAKTLDEVISAHDRYIHGIVRKSLLRVENNNSNDNNNSNNNTTNKNNNNNVDDKQQLLADQVQTLLVIANEFCTLQENLFHDALLSADIAAEKRSQAERRSLVGQWGFDYERHISEEENLFGLADRNTLREVVRVSDLYNENALELLRMLGEKVNGNPDDYYGINDPDVTMMTASDDPNESAYGSRRVMEDVVDADLDSLRFLIAQLDHNDYYGGQEKRQEEHGKYGAVN